VGDLVGEVWSRATAPQPVPQLGLVVGAALVALVVAAVPAAWHVARHLVTVVHEGAHALVAVLTGRRLAGIRLHTDTSGVTVSVGRPRGPGMVATAAAGYPGPAVAGLGVAWLVARGHGVGALWLALAVVVLLLVQVRNGYGLWVLLVGVAALVALTWWTDPGWQVAAATLLAWLLLLGAPRAVVELQTQRWRGRPRGRPGSDADQLAALSHLPAVLWVGAFLLVTTCALGLGGWWLVRAAGA
jgi:hypothetical protein